MAGVALRQAYLKCLSGGACSSQMRSWCLIPSAGTFYRRVKGSDPVVFSFQLSRRARCTALSLLYSGFCRTQSLSRHEINMLGPDMKCPAVVSESTFNRHKWTSQFMNKIYVIYPHSVMHSIIPLTGVYVIYTCINIQSLYNDDIT